jgi:hypothetical protein
MDSTCGTTVSSLPLFTGCTATNVVSSFHDRYDPNQPGSCAAAEGTIHPASVEVFTLCCL